MSLGQLQDLALNRVRPLFATLKGVSAPPPFGASAKTIVVSVDPAKMAKYNLAAAEVAQAIVNSNSDHSFRKYPGRKLLADRPHELRGQRISKRC